MSIAGYVGWPAYDKFLIVSLSSQPIYDLNSLRPNPNPQKPMSGSCHIHKLGWTLTPLIGLHKKQIHWYLDVMIKGDHHRVKAIGSNSLISMKTKPLSIIRALLINLFWFCTRYGASCKTAKEAAYSNLTSFSLSNSSLKFFFFFFLNKLCTHPNLL